MELGERDHITGRMTTGHEWNGIKELNTPVPKVVLFFLAIGALFSIGYWLAMPAWPLGATYTKGLLGVDQRAVVTGQVEAAKVERTQWLDKIAATDFNKVATDPELMSRIREFGAVLYGDNCAACHGVKATGGPGFPDLTAKSWLWGGDPATLADTITIGINSTNDDTRVSQMLAFGRDGMLTRKQIGDVAVYIRSIGPERPSAAAEQVKAGMEIFAANCTACHGENAKGMVESGAPDLTDKNWIYGGSDEQIYTTIHGGRQGHMPHWKDRLSPAEIKLLALFVKQLGGTP